MGVLTAAAPRASHPLGHFGRGGRWTQANECYLVCGDCQGGAWRLVLCPPSSEQCANTTRNGSGRRPGSRL